METNLDVWAESILADPITKEPKRVSDFKKVNGIIDARVYLPNTSGYDEWLEGQESFEGLEEMPHYSRKKVSHFEEEIRNDKPIYENFPLKEPILDIGGSVGLLREFLPNDSQYIVVDPFLNVSDRISAARKDAYACLKRPLNFVSGLAEFLPIQTNSISTVHMRSMLDHVQVVDLCMLEAKRVLRPDGMLIIGITIEGRPYGRKGIDFRPSYMAKTIIKFILVKAGMKRYKDEHVWHPTFSNLQKVILDAGFSIENIYWQPAWKGKVVYIGASVKGY